MLYILTVNIHTQFKLQLFYNLMMEMALIPKSEPQKITLILYVPYIVQKLIYKISFTHTKIHKRQTSTYFGMS
jgi:hypothetical protein